jgi:Putative MetA-pathway of phenol degradation
MRAALCFAAMMLTGCQSMSKRIERTESSAVVRAQSAGDSAPEGADLDDRDIAVERTEKPPPGPDIGAPGPDTANFPNSPLTLPKGRFYVEVSPVFLSGPSVGTAASYNAEFLLRYGLTDNVELRLFGNGPAAERGHLASNGFSPLAYDLKINFWEQKPDSIIPAVGLEAFILTPSGSKGLNQGIQPSINLLFDHRLPLDVVFEWNVGVVGDPSPNSKGSSALEPVVQWAFQRTLVKNFDVFFHGYFNGATLPRFGDGVVLGGGAI